MSRAFVRTASEALSSFELAAKRYKKSPLDTNAASECASCAWHLCEWVFHDHQENLPYQNLRQFKEDLKSRCPSLAYLQDVCVETKHANITRYTPAIKEAREYDGAFSQEFSRAFDISRLQLETEAGNVLDFEDVVDSVLIFWRNFFRETLHDS